MRSAPKPEKYGRDWACVIVWSLVIFISIPLARRIQGFVAERWGREIFHVAVVAVVIATALVVAVRLGRALGWGRAVWVACLAGLYIFLSFRLCGVPEESLHFLEYGFLGLLAFRGFSHWHRSWLVYLCAALLCSLVGTVDEVLQWFTPARFFDFRDIRINSLSAVLMQAGIFTGLRPSYVRGPVRAATVRQACRLGGALVLLLGLCYLNTPPRVDWYARRIPGLDYLRHNESVMSQFGYRIVDPDIGVFRSRFPREELLRQDEVRAGEAAEVLHAYYDRHEAKDAERYLEFLRVYTAGRDPFLHELRVHIRSRDANVRMARSHAPGTEKYVEHMTRAYREQLILGKYFSRSLTRSPYRLTPEQTAALGAEQDPAFPFVSKVSERLNTDFGEGRAWTLVVAGLLLLGSASARFSGAGRKAPGSVPTSGKPGRE